MLSKHQTAHPYRSTVSLHQTGVPPAWRLMRPVLLPKSTEMSRAGPDLDLASSWK